MRRAIHPQAEMLPGMPEPEPQFDPVRPDIRNALARALRPEYLGLDPRDYADITPVMVELAAPENLRPSLINVPHDSPSSVIYRQPDEQTRLYVAATPEEFNLLAGSIRTLGQRAVARTEIARQRQAGLTETDYAATQRAGAHAVEGSVNKMKKYLERELIPEQALLARFREAAKYPGLARFSDEGDMRMSLTLLREGVLGKMLKALRAQRGWSQEQEDLARRAIERRLFIDRERNQHIGRFSAMLALAQQRNGYLEAITRSRLREADTYIKNQYVNAS